MNQVVATESSLNLEQMIEGNLKDFVTFVIDNQLFGIEILNVQDILRPERIAFIPLAPPEVRGSINLRGRIVTVIDVRVCLGLPKREIDSETMGVTVEHGGELYTLMVDKVGEVQSLEPGAVEKVPGTLDAEWRAFASGVCQLEERLMVILDIEQLLQLIS